MPVYNSILEIIGNTPTIHLQKIGKSCGKPLFAKLESYNPGGSIKSRPAYNMIYEAEQTGKLTPGMTIIEPTSGNTGIGLALVGGLKGYKVKLIMPEDASLERRTILKAYGAELILVEAANGMSGAIQKAHSLQESDPNVFVPQQFQNPENPNAHRQTTALEIWEDMNHQLDAFVACVGTGGTITGVGETLKQLDPSIQIVAVEPKKSPVLSGGDPQRHKIQGMGAGFIPKVLNTEIFDEIIAVSEEDAFKTTRELTRKEGIFAGISSGAAIWAALSYAQNHPQAKRILSILPDTGERYLSTDLWKE